MGSAKHPNEIEEDNSIELIRFLERAIFAAFKTNMGTNFENPHGKNLDLKVKMCFTSKKLVLGQNGFYSGLSQNTPKMKHFFGYAGCVQK